MAQTPHTQILYNDTCGICAREMDSYAREAAVTGAELQFCPLSTAEQFGLDQDTAARRLHVLQNGQLIAGIDAFIAIWAALPRLAWLAKIARVPLIHGALGAVYDHVLAPIIYRRHLRRLRLKASK
jgi:predicted DCC family thiol-disulfide oxidoreductase YuxK